MATAVSLREVPKDHDNLKIYRVYNPLSEKYVHRFNGEEMVIESGESMVATENVCVLIARHLAKKVVELIAEDELEEVLKKIDPSKRNTIRMKPIQNYVERVAEVSKILVLEESLDKSKYPKKTDIVTKASNNTNKMSNKEKMSIIENKSTKKQ